ncbi:MAG: glycosyltransferase [Vicingus serpentipes]|nr:glycosyltransferase [Vicingus serpentipes]
MKITIIGTAHPFRGGIAVFIERLAKAFKTNGDDVEISTFTLQYPSILFPGETQLSSSSKPTNLTIIEEVNSINPFNWLKVGRRIKKTNPDIVIFKYWIPFMAPCFGTISRIIRKNKHSKTVVVVDNIIPHEKRIGDNLLNNYFVNSVDGFIAMSQSVLDDLNTFDSKKPKILSPHPLYDNFGEAKDRVAALKALNLDPSYRYMLFFGIIRQYKGLDILLKAFADKRLNDGKKKLIIAGEFYENDTEYMALIEQHNLKDAVVLATKFIPDEKVVNYFCAADIIVQPYKHATQSGVTQIAYHFEKPMLVTDVGGLREIVPHHKVGYVTQPNEKEVAEALIDFYENNRLEEFTTGTKEEKQKYTWQKMVDNIYEVYSETKEGNTV